MPHKNMITNKFQLIINLIVDHMLFFRAGNICTYVSNQRMSVAVDTIETTVRNNLDDVDTYLNLIQKVPSLINTP